MVTPSVLSPLGARQRRWHSSLPGAPLRGFQVSPLPGRTPRPGAHRSLEKASDPLNWSY
ncbi:mCG1045255 [Mus musculus]|nr:mCG1045255 [Mus musculus]